MNERRVERVVRRGQLIFNHTTTTTTTTTTSIFVDRGRRLPVYAEEDVVAP
jgi:hypothetical protein